MSYSYSAETHQTETQRHYHNFNRQEASLALEVQAAATEMQGLRCYYDAQELYRRVLMEAEPLHNEWDETDFFVPYLRRRVDELT